MFSFLRKKLADVSIGHLIFLEIEGFLYWIFNTVPGTIGFCLRNITAHLLFHKVKGFCWIQPRVTLVESNRLSVGQNFAVNSGTYINAKGSITVGNDVVIGSNVTISSGRHPIEGRTPTIFSRPTIPEPIVIEDDVWIGAGAVIMPGITLRQGTVVGANSTVLSDTEPYAVMVGSPARKVRTRKDAAPKPNPTAGQPSSTKRHIEREGGPLKKSAKGTVQGQHLKGIRSTERKISLFIAILAVIFVSVLACNDRDGMVGDTSLYAEMTETILKTGMPESVIHASTQDYIDRGISAVPVDDRITQPEYVTGPTIHSRNILSFHFYLILYLLAPFTLLASGVTILTVAQVASFIMSLWILYTMFREKGTPIPVVLAGILLVICHPGYGGSLYGPFYPDKLFVFFGVYLIYSVVRPNYSPLQFGIAFVLCILTGERAALFTGAFLLAWTIFNWEKIPSRRLSFLCAGLAAMIYYYVLTHFILDNLYYNDLSLQSLIQNFFHPGYGFLVLKFLLINVVLFGCFAIFDWRAALIGYCSLIPNLIYFVGGSEKLGWTLHYHCYYFPILLWAVLCGISAIYQLAARRKDTKISVRITIAPVFLLCLLLACFEPFSTTSISWDTQNIRHTMPAMTARKAAEFSALASLERGFCTFIDNTIKPGSTTTAIEGAMPYLYRTTNVSVYPMDISTVDYIVASYYLDESGIVRLMGATTYFGTEETARYNAALQSQLSAYGFDFTQASYYEPYSVIVIPRIRGAFLQ